MRKKLLKMKSKIKKVKVKWKNKAQKNITKRQDIRRALQRWKLTKRQIKNRVKTKNKFMRNKNELKNK